jgi:hypothetical protein
MCVSTTSAFHLDDDCNNIDAATKYVTPTCKQQLIPMMQASGTPCPTVMVNAQESCTSACFGV